MSLKFFEKNTPSSNSQFWFAWFGVIIVVCIIHSLTLTIAPLPFLDETSFFEIGRTTLDPQTNWSTNWSVMNDQAYLVPYYLGGILQELSLRSSNFSMVGPRLFGILGGMIAATMAVGWLLSRRIPKKIAFLLGLVFLLDPLFVFIYRFNRVDSWTIALCLAACWILRTSANNIQQGKLNILPIAVAGSFTATAPFIHPNAIILYPLVLLELATLVWQGRSINKGWKQALNPLFIFVLAGIVATIILVIPIWHQLNTMLTNFYWYSKYNATASASTAQYSLLTLASVFLYCFNISPILPLSALVGIRYNRDKLLLVSTLFAVTFVVTTRPYPVRAVSLLPYFLVLTASIFTFVPKASPKAKANLRLIRSSILLLLLTWAIGISLILRPSLGLTQKSAKDPTLLYNIGISEIGPNAKVYDASYHFYYVGRSLNWQMFHVWPWDKRFEEIWNENTFQKFLSKVDYVILQEEPGSIGGTVNILNNDPKILEKAGLKYRKTILANASKSPRFFLDRVVFGGGLPYGRYRLYSREK